jgi:hypothetical protein
MKIAEVGINIKSLPSKEVLIEQALKTKKFYQMPKKKALEMINKEIKDSGLFKTSTTRVKKSKVNVAEDDSGRGNNKQSKHNKASKK